MSDPHDHHATISKRSRFICALASSVAAASMALCGSLVAAEADAPLFPLSVLTDDPYGHDPSFNLGNWHEFGNGAPSRDFHGRKAVRLSNGDIVVAGLVPRWNDTNPASGMWNIGLVRYAANGSYADWGAATPHHVQPHYVNYPNLTNPHYADIKDMKVFGNHIYVLADRWRENAPGTNNRLGGYVVVFHTNGTYVSHHAALDFSVQWHETAASMAFFQPSGAFPTPPAILYIAGTTTGADVRQLITMTKMVRASNGTLSHTNDLGSSFDKPYIDYFVPASYCVDDARPCHQLANALAITTQGFGAALRPRIHIGGAARRDTSGNWAFLVMRTNAGGVLDTSLCTGANCDGFAMITGMGPRRAEVRSIVATSVDLFNGADELLLVGDVERNDSAPHYGTGIVATKLNNNGTLDTSFGVNGSTMIGGCAQGQPCQVLTQPSDHVRGAVLADGRLAIAGWSGLNPAAAGPTPPPYWVKRPMFAILDATTGSVREDRLLYSPAPFGHGEALSLLPGGGGTFVLAGYSAAPSNGHRFITTRVRSDRIFGHGFQP